MPHFSAQLETFSFQPKEKQKQLTQAIAFVSSFAAIEALVGGCSHSLALLADAGHLVADSAALGLALWAARATRPALKSGWIGTHQLAIQPSPTPETWAALVNSLGLVGLSIWIAIESFLHFYRPSAPEIETIPMVITAIVGAIVNGINITVLHSGSQQDLNLKGAFLHVVGDFIGSLGVIGAAIAVAVMHWVWADCVVGLAIALLMTVSALPLVWQSGRRIVQDLYQIHP